MRVLNPSRLGDMLNEVYRFHEEVTGMPVPKEPTLLTGEGFKFRWKHLYEELDELDRANSVADQADALVDIAYVALGGLLQMGIPPGPAFDEVHRANMHRKPGRNARRGNADHDAVKPEGWKPPDWDFLLSVTPAEFDLIRELRKTMPNAQGPFVVVDRAKPKLLVIGHARHGKDTVCEMLRDKYGFKFTSSSWFCAERVMMPYFDKKTLDHNERPYRSVQECYDDRSNHRQEWYEAIRDFNRSDLTALGRAIWAENDVYCGLRHHSEFHALNNACVFDHCIWVDASDRMPAEPRTSMTLEPWMADRVLDNNGTLEDLARNLDQLMEHLT